MDINCIKIAFKYKVETQLNNWWRKTQFLSTLSKIAKFEETDAYTNWIKRTVTDLSLYILKSKSDTCRWQIRNPHFLVISHSKTYKNSHHTEIRCHHTVSSTVFSWKTRTDRHKDTNAPSAIAKKTAHSEPLPAVCPRLQWNVVTRWTLQVRLPPASVVLCRTFSWCVFSPPSISGHLKTLQEVCRRDSNGPSCTFNS